LYLFLERAASYLQQNTSQLFAWMETIWRVSSLCHSWTNSFFVTALCLLDLVITGMSLGWGELVVGSAQW